MEALRIVNPMVNLSQERNEPEVDERIVERRDWRRRWYPVQLAMEYPHNRRERLAEVEAGELRHVQTKTRKG